MAVFFPLGDGTFIPQKFGTAFYCNYYTRETRGSLTISYQLIILYRLLHIASSTTGSNGKIPPVRVFHSQTILGTSPTSLPDLSDSSFSLSTPAPLPLIASQPLSHAFNDASLSPSPTTSLASPPPTIPTRSPPPPSSPTAMSTPPPHHPVAIITGAASGIGLALTTHLLAKNYKVFMADINPAGALTAAALPLPSPSTPPPTFIPTDIASFPAQLALFQRAYAYNHSIDVFAANAGIDDSEDVFAADVSPVSLNGAETDTPATTEPPSVAPPNLKTLDVDLSAVVSGLKLFVAFARHSARADAAHGRAPRKRSMVITASMVGLYPFETNPLYCAAKHGLIGLTRSVGPRLARERIAVNAILPAFVPTGLAPPGLVDAVRAMGHLTPMSTVLQAYETLLDGDAAGETVECSLGELFWRRPVAYPNESQRWLNEDAAGVWGGAYGKVRAEGGRGGGG
ncbi:hypothetical protein MMC27_003377 [Xylographa pallens]|nr:hypothetical protein [Xylographa pallens]